MAAFRTGLAGAQDRIAILVNDRKLARRFAKLARQSPAVAERAMVKAVTWWDQQARPHIPVRGSRRKTLARGALARGPRYSRVGRGQLRKRTSKFVKVTAAGVSGGIRSTAPYAVWLMAGTRRIAKGRVMRWRHGQRRITDWPAKRLGGNPRGEMPILIPWIREARELLLDELGKTILARRIAAQ